MKRFLHVCSLYSFGGPALYETDSSLGSELPSSVDQSIAERKTSMISGRTDIENRQVKRDVVVEIAEKGVKSCLGNANFNLVNKVGRRHLVKGSALDLSRDHR